MSKISKKMKKMINNNDFIIIIISLIIFIIGGLTLNWIISFIAVALIDSILFIPKLFKKKKRRKMSKTKKKKILKIVLIGMITLFIILIIVCAVFFYIIVKKAPDFNPDNLYQKEASILYDINGEVFARLGAEKRENISYDEISEVLIDAIVATEDSRFFQHNGFDLPRFVKASFYQMLGQRDAGGASTLTMQLSKQHYTSTEASGLEGIIRKFTDIYISIFKIEKRYTKEQILEFYLNSNYLGAYKYGGAYGVEQACLTYFGKSAKDINLAEASLIAGLFNAPNALDPYNNPEGAEARRKVVLSLMERHGFINKEERKAAEEITVEQLIIEHEYNANEYQGFIDTVVEEIIDLTDENPYVTPMLIYTTMNTDKQDHLNKVINGDIFTWENDKVIAGVAVVDIDSGAIAAVGTGRNKEGARNLNYATLHNQIKKQIGSTAKPLFSYGPGIEYNNWSTYTPFVDEAHSYSNGNNVENWDRGYDGFMTLRDALVYSRNIPALKAFQSVSNKNIYNFVTSLNLNPQIEGTLVHEAHSIGGYNGESPLSVASAYAAFGNGGYYTKPYSFTKIVYRQNNEEFENKPKKTRVMSESTAYMMTDILIDTAKYALGWNSYINGKTYAAKTGTTNFPNEAFKQLNLPSNAINDLWVAGYDPEYSIAVWYGYDPITKDHVSRFGNTNHASLFQTIAKGVFTGNSSFKKSNDVVEVAVEKETYPAMLPSEFTPSNMITKELFKKGSEPTEVSVRYDRLNDVTNLNGEVNSNTVKLTWDPIKTPDAINNDKLASFFRGIYKVKSNQTKYLNARLSYNKSNIGNLIYNIYLKQDGKLSLIGSTPNTEYSLNVTSGSKNQTYVVKSTYTIFKANASSGSEITVSLNNNETAITSYLNGSETINLNVGESYVYAEDFVIVKEFGIDIPINNIDLNITIRRKNGDVINDNEITTEQPETFIITYIINYKDHQNTLERRIIVK